MRLGFLALLAALLLPLFACQRGEPAPGSPAAPGAATASAAASAPVAKAAATPAPAATAGRGVALLAGGCFWGMEELLRKLPGVVDTTVGYAGGALANPDYDAVKTGRSGHAESVRVAFDPSKISYARILEYFFSIHDPTTKNRQGNDVGTQYRSAIFAVDEAQRRTAEAVMARVTAAGDWKNPLTTRVVLGTTFYPAEDYHQDYLQKNPGGYTCHYPRDVSFY